MLTLQRSPTDWSVISLVHCISRWVRKPEFQNFLQANTAGVPVQLHGGMLGFDMHALSCSAVCWHFCNVNKKMMWQWHVQACALSGKYFQHSWSIIHCAMNHVSVVLPWTSTFMVNCHTHFSNLPLYCLLVTFSLNAGPMFHHCCWQKQSFTTCLLNSSSMFQPKT